MRFPLLSPGKYIYITTFFPKDPKVFYKNIHTNHFPTGVQSLMRHRVAARGKWYTGLCKFIAGGKILPKDRGANPYPDDCQELTHIHRQQTAAWFQSAPAEMSLSTFTGKGYLGQIWNTQVMKTWSSLTKQISHAGIAEQGLDAWNSYWLEESAWIIPSNSHWHWCQGSPGCSQLPQVHPQPTSHLFTAQHWQSRAHP